jgi:hypothetical protein
LLCSAAWFVLLVLTKGTHDRWNQRYVKGWAHDIATQT